MTLAPPTTSSIGRPALIARGRMSSPGSNRRTTELRRAHVRVRYLRRHACRHSKWNPGHPPLRSDVDV
jgi:hypothetical protein